MPETAGQKFWLPSYPPCFLQQVGVRTQVLTVFVVDAVTTLLKALLVYFLFAGCVLNCCPKCDLLYFDYNGICFIFVFSVVVSAIQLYWYLYYSISHIRTITALCLHICLWPWDNPIIYGKRFFWHRSWPFTRFFWKLTSCPSRDPAGQWREAGLLGKAWQTFSSSPVIVCGIH